MKTIKLSDTQYAVLLKALEELADSEHGEGCNDLFEGDKFHTLTLGEQVQARMLIDPETIIHLGPNPDPEGLPPGFNSTATEYLLDILQKQGEKPVAKKKRK